MATFVDASLYIQLMRNSQNVNISKEKFPPQDIYEDKHYELIMGWIECGILRLKAPLARSQSSVSVSFMKKQFQKFEQKKHDSKIKLTRITQIIQLHLKDSKCILGGILNEFTKIFTRYYDNLFLLCIREDNYQQVKLDVQDLYYDLRQFIRTIQDATFKFYEKSIQFDKQYTWKENISTFISHVIISDQILEIIFKYQTYIDQSKQQIIYSNIKILQNLEPQYLGISSALCLNNITLQKYKIKNVAKQDSEENKPYHIAIQQFKQLSQASSQIQKMQIIVQTSELIAKCIEQFYSNHKISEKQEYGGDENVQIFYYIAIKSNISNLKSHMSMIENLISSNICNSKPGYYFVTLQIVQMHLETPKKNERSDQIQDYSINENLFTQKLNRNQTFQQQAFQKPLSFSNGPFENKSPQNSNNKYFEL